jgi:hypothetical protein
MAIADVTPTLAPKVDNEFPKVDNTKKNLLQVAEQLINLNRGRETFRRIAAKFHSELKISEKTMLEWKQEFNIKISSSPTLEEIRSNLAICLKNYQTADHFLRVTKAAYATAENDYKIAVAEEVRRLIGLYNQKVGQKPPARELIEAEAKAECLDLACILVNALIFSDFWQDMVWMIKFLKEDMEAIQNNLSIEAKLQPRG